MGTFSTKVNTALKLHPELDWQPYVAMQLHSFATISFFVFISATQAFLLTSQYNVPGFQIGFVTGRLALADEITSLVALFIWGSLSDRIGRRKVLAFGYAISALGLFTIPLGTNWDPDLVLTRIVFAFGSSAMATVMTAMLGEVVTPQGLPRASSMMGIMSGVGALCAAYGYLRLGAVTCLRATYFVIAGICIVLGIVIVYLYKGVSTEHHSSSVRDVVKNVAEVPSLIKRDPNLGLAILASFPARSGSVVASLYLSSWFVNYMRSTGECPPAHIPPTNVSQTFCGLSDTRCAAAVAASSSANGILQVVALVGALFVGFCMEKCIRHPRVGVCIAGFIGLISFCSVAAVDNPRSSAIYGVAFAMGLSQISMIISAQVFLVRQMPKEKLGVLSGCFSTTGALAVIMIGVWGGEIFDTGFYQGPFVMVGVVFGIIFVLSALVIKFVPVIDNEERTSMEKPLNKTDAAVADVDNKNDVESNAVEASPITKD